MAGKVKRKVSKKSKTRRRYRRRPKATINKSMVVLGKGFPKKMMITHKYFETFQMSQVSGSTATYRFSCNGMYDPNVTGTGHQPMGFDLLSSIYNHYSVIGSKIILKVGAASNANTNSTVALWINDDTTTVPTLSGLVEQNTAKFTVINYGNVDTHQLTTKWSAKKTFGGSVLGNDNLQGTVGTNPPEQSYYEINIFPYDAATQSYICQVYIEYIAIWEEIKDLASS